MPARTQAAAVSTWLQLGAANTSVQLQLHTFMAEGNQKF